MAIAGWIFAYLVMFCGPWLMLLPLTLLTMDVEVRRLVEAAMGASVVGVAGEDIRGIFGGFQLSLAAVIAAVEEFVKGMSRSTQQWGGQKMDAAKKKNQGQKMK